MRDRSRNMTLRAAGRVDLASPLQSRDARVLRSPHTSQRLGRREGSVRAELATANEAKANRAQSE